MKSLIKAKCPKIFTDTSIYISKYLFNTLFITNRFAIKWQNRFRVSVTKKIVKVEENRCFRLDGLIIKCT